MHINSEKLKEIVPAWAADATWLASAMNHHLGAWLGRERIDPHVRLAFWFELVGGALRLVTPSDDGVDNSGHLVIAGVVNPLGSPCQVEVPLNSAMTGYKPLGNHSVYFHGIQTETALYYFGITKQRWHARFAQHVSDARNGSPYVFHRALAHHAGKPMVHRLLDAALPFEYAMKTEEDLVGEFGLYPKGMNMIPGGFAGFRYLATLGHKPANVRQRDAVIERLSRLPTVKGKPNPLCAARWQADQDYVNRIICGHGDRLSVEQVRQIRLLSSFGERIDAVMQRCDLSNRRQVQRVVTGKRYGRVA